MILTENEPYLCEEQDVWTMKTTMKTTGSRAACLREAYHVSILKLERKSSFIERRGSTNKVRFDACPVATVHYRPYTSIMERNQLFYQHEDYKQFKWDRRRALFDDSTEEADEPEFSVLTAAFSLVLALLLCLAFVLSRIERFLIKSDAVESLSNVLIEKGAKVVSSFLQMEDSDLVVFRTL
jgi:hypothetical protein